MAAVKKPRQKRKMPHSGSGAIDGFHFTVEQWRVFETKLGRPLSPDLREQLRKEAAYFRMDWITEVSWPDVDNSLKKQKEVERAASLLLDIAFHPDEQGLTTLLTLSGVTERDTKRLLRLYRHLASLHIKTQKYRLLLTELREEARAKAEQLLSASSGVERGPKGWRPKYRLLLSLKQILYPDDPSLPIQSKLRNPEVDGPRRGSSFFTSQFAEFLTAYFDKIPDNQFKPTLEAVGQMIKKFNGEYRQRSEKGIVESRF